MQQPSGSTVAPAALPDLPDAIARFALSPGDYSLSKQDQEIDFVLRIRTATEVPRGDFLCRAYPFDADGEPVDATRSTWTRSPHFDALYTYLPAFSGRDGLVSLTPFEIDAPFDLLVLVVQPWREPAVEIAVAGCLLRRRERSGGHSTSYRLISPLTDA